MPSSFNRILSVLLLFGITALIYSTRLLTPTPKPTRFLTTSYRFDTHPNAHTRITPKKVAIIGAGSAGASTAYYLRRFATNASIPLDITVFERSDFVGGRSTTVNAYDDADHPIELGASIFVEVNANLVSATEELGLDVVDLERVPRDEGEEREFSANFAVYNGEEMVFTMPYIDGKKDAWWNNIKVLWRYGMAPIYTQRLMKSTVGKFLSFYAPPVFPFKDLTETAINAGLLETTGVTGQQYLEKNGIASKWSNEVIQASTRVNYGQNLGLIHGLETMVCMAAEGALAIKGGNWRIFAGMIGRAEATLKLGTTVTDISKDESGKWRLATEDGPVSGKFDEVVVAAPWQFANLTMTPELEGKPDEIPYVTLHVTLFASPHTPAPEFYGLSAGEKVPEAVLTTLTEAEQADDKINGGRGEAAAGKSGFFSISTLRKLTRKGPDGKDRKEYIYKIFSPKPFDDAGLARVLGKEKLGEDDVTWVYRKVWKSYPYELPRVTFEKIKLADGLWYTSGIESFISTMETSSLMGSNVAGLIVEEWLSGKENGEGEKLVVQGGEKGRKEL
ncbi:Prenylcysteine oxidase [Ascobolus immersus RN42]|uniref:Prenylcysteine oxidase n=1 Tax=Ascobolus immersus RN42 TaxID=1160509 RepID=A0A3N4HIR2_ASCIM|nr:Prenylcysteine oxidase [Ascobolus immersus RN42]